MMRSTTTTCMIIFSFAMLILSDQVQQSQGLAVIALASAARPTFLGRLMRTSQPPSTTTSASVIVDDDDTTASRVATQTAAFVGMGSSSSSSSSSVSTVVDEFSSQFNEDQYRREMLSLVYDRSMERLLK